MSAVKSSVKVRKNKPQSDLPLFPHIVSGPREMTGGSITVGSVRRLSRSGERLPSYWRFGGRPVTGHWQVDGRFRALRNHRKSVNLTTLRPSGGIGRRTGLKILWAERPVRVRVPPRPITYGDSALRRNAVTLYSALDEGGVALIHAKPVPWQWDCQLCVCVAPRDESAYPPLVCTQRRLVSRPGQGRDGPGSNARVHSSHLEHRTHEPWNRRLASTQRLVP